MKICEIIALRKIAQRLEDRPDDHAKIWVGEAYSKAELIRDLRELASP